jgi:drug/metabolite transporter (DMT)-like permease
VPPTTTPWHPQLFLTLAALCWAGNHVVARAIAGTVPPATVNVLRWLLVIVLVGLFAARTIRRDWPVLRQHWRLLAALGASGGGIFGTLQYVGLQYTSVVNMGVLNSVAPGLIVLASFLAFRDPIRPLQVFGIALSLTGVLAMVSKLDLGNLAALAFNHGDVIIFANMVMFALYSAYLRWRPPVALASFLFAISIPSALVNLPFAIAEHLTGSSFPITPLAIGAVVYAGLLTSIVAYLSWSRGVEALGPGRASVFLHTIPVFNTLFGTFLLGEALQVYHAVGFALILAGVWLTTCGSGRGPPAKVRRSD